MQHRDGTQRRDFNNHRNEKSWGKLENSKMFSLKLARKLYRIRWKYFPFNSQSRFIIICIPLRVVILNT